MTIPGGGVHERLDDPYKVGGSPPPDASVLPVVIDDRAYLIDTSRQTNQQERFRRTSIQLLNTQQNPEKGESALTPPEVWRRTYQSWHHGMGQKFADREDSDPFRYDWSKGIDPWTNQWQVGLLHDTRHRDTSNNYLTGTMVNGISVGLLAGQTTITASLGALTQQKTVAAGSRIATDGYYLYTVGDDKKLHTYTVTPNMGTVDIDEVGTAKDLTFLTAGVDVLVMANFKLLVCCADGQVWDATSYLGNGTPTPPTKPVIKPPIPGYTWVAGCSGKKAIYLLGYQGDKSAVHSVRIDENDATLDGGIVAELPDGEQGTAIYSYLGYVAIGTSKGFRFAATGNSDAAITYGPLIETPRPVLCFEGQDRFLYYGLSGFDGDTGIGRADLSQFVTDLQPAYASDLMATGQASHETTFINTLANGTILFGTTGGTWEQDVSYVSQGVIRLSAWTFNVVDRKTGLYVMTTNTTNTGGGGRLDAFYDQSTTPTYLGSAVSSNTANQKFQLVNSTFNSVALQATLNPSPDRSKTPLIYSVEMRATYIRGKATEWQVPCILHDSIEQDNGAVQDRDVVADFNHLIGLVESGRQFVYREDEQQWLVYATDFIWSPQERSVASGWQGVFTIYFREVR